MSASDATDVKLLAAVTGKSINMDKIRQDSIEKRRQRAIDILKLRKRKLSELYYVNKSPFIPISDQKIIETQGNLLEFLDRNDFEKNRKFELSSLPPLGVSRSSSNSTPLRNNNNSTTTPRQMVGRNIPNSNGNPAAIIKRQQHTSSASPPAATIKRISPPLQQKPKSQIVQQTPKSKVMMDHQQVEQHPTPSASSSDLLSSSSSSSLSQSPSVPYKSDETEGPPLKIQKTAASVDVKKESSVVNGDPKSTPIEKSITNDEESNQQESSQNPSISPVVVNNNNNINQTIPEEIPQFQEVYEVPLIPKDYTPLPTLTSFIQAYADSRPADLTKEELLLKKRQLDISEIDINKLSVLLTPSYLPSQIPESSPLAELYYLTQTCPLSKLIPTTHKALTTETYESALLEGKLAVVYSRIEELKRQKKWSLRQPQRYHDPFILHSTHKSHWGNLLDEAKWMATDFKEGRKFKMVQCLFIAQAVSDYWNYGKVMCIKRKQIKFLDEKDEQSADIAAAAAAANDDNMAVDEEDLKNDHDESEPEPESTAEIEKEEKIEETQETIDVSLLLKRPDPTSEIVPPKLPEFTKEELPKNLQPFKMYVDKSELSALNGNIIDSLPVYEAFMNETHEKRELPIIPVSKLLTPKDEDDDDWYNVILKENYFFRGSSYATEKGLFGFSSTKRLTFIRPPMPPPLKYLDLRIPTIWLPEDDRHLIRYVAEFQFNWGIISAHLSARATNGYFSNIERRTPWQCFERYIQLNDKFQFSDMRGGYTPQAQLWLEAAHKAQTTTKRRISPLGVGNESIQRGHKRLRWASMFEAMRKLMKKRENAPKTTGSNLKKDDKKISAPTPLDLAKLKYERDKAIQEAYLHQNTNLNMKRTTSLQQQQQQQQVGSHPQSRANSANAQVLLVQRQLAAAAAVANGNGNKLENSSELIAHQQLLQIQQLRRMQKQNSTGGVNNGGGTGIPRQASPNGIGSNTIISRNGTPNSQKSQLHASNAALQAQQLRLQQQLQLQKEGLARSNSSPIGTSTGDNNGGTPYTNEQLQQLMILQRQRNLQQQLLQSAPTSRVNSNNGTPVMANAEAIMSPVGSNGNTNTTTTTGGGGANVTVTPAKSNFPNTFSNSQVTAIVQQIQTQHPHLNKQQVSRLAASYLHNLSTQQQQLQHRAAMTNQSNVANVIKSTAGNPGTPLLKPTGQQLQQGTTTPQPARNLVSSLQMLNSAQLTKLANSPTLTANQRQQILSVQQQRLRNAGQAVLASSSNNRLLNNNNNNNNNNVRSTPSVNRTNATNTSIPTPQQLASQRAKLQEQQQQQNDGDTPGP